MTYQFERYPNKSMAAIHTTIALPEFNHFRTKPGDDGYELMKALEDIPGVESAERTCRKYKVVLEKGTAFEWAPILGRAAEVICEHLGVDVEDTRKLPDIEPE